jgi:hypothetical protein
MSSSLPVKKARIKALKSGGGEALLQERYTHYSETILPVEFNLLSRLTPVSKRRLKQ